MGRQPTCRGPINYSEVPRKIMKFLSRKGRQINDRILDIGDLRIKINADDPGGMAYLSRSSFEERNSAVYPCLRSSLNPQVIVDVGANYGFTTVIFGKTFPDATIVSIEATPELIKFVEENLRLNDISRCEIVNAVCGAQASGKTSFAINPNGSQDNRVLGQSSWKTVQCDVTSLDALLASAGDKPFFVKIDTQGYEPLVFEGARAALGKHGEWLVKMEFAPYWLRSQGHSPEDFLQLLIARYRVTEAPARARFGHNELGYLFSSALSENAVRPFVQHVESLNGNGRGWVDLYVAAREARWLEVLRTRGT